MAATKSKIKADPFAALREAIDAPNLPFDEVPEGWHTAVEISEQVGLAPDTTRKRLLNGIRAGTVERKKFRIDTSRGAYPTPHYRAITPENT